MAENVHRAVIHVPHTRLKDWTFRILLRGDAHHDNPKSDHDLQRKHLDECMANGWAWLDVGDLFCAMGGKYDPRAKKNELRPEHALAESYLDSLVHHNAEFLRPYMPNCLVLGQGNHETAMEKRHETDLNWRLAQAVGRPDLAGGYGGWVHLVVDACGSRAAMKIKYFHGSGGGGMMSFGTLAARRMASWVLGADVVVCGHIHERWHLELTGEDLRTEKGYYGVELASQHHVRVGTYKEEYNRGIGGFHVERGAPPKPIGAYWMILRYRMNSRNNYRLLGATFEPTW